MPRSEMGERFRKVHRIYRRSVGSAWTGAEIERASGGEVSRHYVSKLRHGYYEDPGFGKIAAISRVMGIPLEAWTGRGEGTHRP